MNKRIGGVFVIAGLLVSVSSAGLFGQMATEKSLYDRLGGKKSIAAVVDEFVGRVFNGSPQTRTPKRLGKPARINACPPRAAITIGRDASRIGKLRKLGRARRQRRPRPSKR